MELSLDKSRFSQKLFQGVCGEFGVFLAVTQNVAGKIDGVSERLLAGLVFSCNVIGGAVGRRGADDVKSCGVVDTFGERHQLEGYKTLVVV